MSTTKTSAHEECGVWLDTVQLKGKAKQKRLARPISKLLNPFAGGGGYSLAVALNFTQTQMKMPKTKQSSISAYFTSHHRGPKNMSILSCSSTATAPTNISSGTKRRHESDLEKPDMYKSKLSHDWFSKNMLDKQQPVRQEYEEESPTPSKDAYFESKEEHFEELNPPQSKRFTDSFLLAGGTQLPPQAWSQDPLFTCSHQMDNEKETRTALSPNSPRKHSFFSHADPVSNHKRIQSTTASPCKYIPDRLWKQNDKEEGNNSLLWRKPRTRSSPLKKQVLVQQNRDIDDSLAMLFTQDSEGFRVIAHRGLQTRSPLKDQTNVSTGTEKICVYKSQMEEDEEDEMLFTQDSQGNMVIKH